MSRLRRFLHIERSREPSAAPPQPAPPDAATSGRFSGVERPAARPAPGAASGGSLERFSAPPRAPDGALELGGAQAGERPFTRCQRCGMDHHVLATACTGCGAPLDTPEQRAFNEGLWARLRQEAAGAEAELAARREAQARADAELAARRRAMGEELAREVGEAERRRLDAAEGRWGGGRVVLPRRLVEGGGGRVILAVVIAAVALLGILALLGHRRALAVAGAVLLSLLLRGRRRRPWWWW